MSQLVIEIGGMPHNLQKAGQYQCAEYTRDGFATFLGTQPIKMSISAQDGEVEGYARTDVHTCATQVGVLFDHGNFFAIRSCTTL